MMMMIYWHKQKIYTLGYKISYEEEKNTIGARFQNMCRFRNVSVSPARWSKCSQGWQTLRSWWPCARIPSEAWIFVHMSSMWNVPRMGRLGEQISECECCIISEKRGRERTNERKKRNIKEKEVWCGMILVLLFAINEFIPLSLIFITMRDISRSVS